MSIVPDAQWNFKRRMVALQTTLRTWFDDHARRRRSCRSCLMPSGISSDACLLCKPRCALDVMPDAHRRYESFDPFCASTTMTPKEGSVGATGVATSFWRKSCAGAPFRNRGRKVSNSNFEEVLGGSAISKSNPKVSKSFEIVFSKKCQAKPPFRNGHTVWHLKF